MKILILFSLFAAISCTNWCEIEHDKCGGKFHVGCETHEGEKHDWHNTSFRDMTTEWKEYIIKTWNNFKSDLAAGKIEGYPEASKFLVSFWNDDFEYLAKQGIKKYGTKDEGCAVIDGVQNTHAYIFTETLLNAEAHEHDIFDFIKSGITHFIDELKHKSEREVGWYFGETSKLGCSVAVYEETVKGVETHNHVLRCYVDTLKDYGETYDHGKVCSKCSDYHLDCCIIYHTMCMDLAKHGHHTH